MLICFFLVDPANNYNNGTNNAKGPVDIIPDVTFLKLYPRVDEMDFNPADFTHLTTDVTDRYQKDGPLFSSEERLLPTMRFDCSDIVTAIRETAKSFKTSKPVAPIDIHSVYVQWNNSALPTDVKKQYLIKQRSTTIQTFASLLLFSYEVDVPGAIDPSTHLPTTTKQFVTRRY